MSIEDLTKKFEAEKDGLLNQMRQYTKNLDDFKVRETSLVNEVTVLENDR